MPSDLLALVAARHGHFRMESGYHSDQWFELDRLFDHPARLQPFVTALAQRLVPHRPEVICGPQSGGAQLAELIANELGIAYAFTERFEPAASTALFPVQYRVPPTLHALVRGRSVAVVDDAISAGSAVRGTLADLRDHGARAVGLGALIVFGPKAATYAAEQQLPLECLAPVDFNLWLPAACPLCARGVPVESVSDAL